jgi:hypothetical protein
MVQAFIYVSIVILIALTFIAPSSSTSLGYARSQQGWSKSIFSKKTSGAYMQCLCLCEGMSLSCVTG